jgi:hypothetical protein
LITSRYGEELRGIRRQELALFTPEEAREYLRSHLHAGLLAQLNGEATLDAVAEAVDYLPLALELVASYIHETRQSPTEWLEEWRETPAATIAYHDADALNYPLSLARVWEQSISLTSTNAREILHSLAWLAPRPATVPLRAFREAQDWPRIRVALGELAKASLVTWPIGAEEITVHRVLQVVARHSLNDEERTSSLASALTRLVATLPSPEWNEGGWALWERLAPHCRALLDHLCKDALEPDAARIMNDLALWLYHRAEYGEAEPLYQRALAIWEKVLGPEHPHVATCSENYAALLLEMGRTAEAASLESRARVIRAKQT